MCSLKLLLIFDIIFLIRYQGVSNQLEDKERKVALLTGSATGLGAVIAHSMAMQKYSLIINYRTSNKEPIHTIENLKSLGACKAIALQGDVSDPNQVEKMVDQAFAYFGKIDILIHTAGPFLRERKPLTENSLDEWFQMMNGNLSSAFFLCKKIIPAMRKQGYGRIIHFGYDRAEMAGDQFYRGPYASAKTGLVSLTKTLALEERPHGITVNMICPGDIRKKEKEAAIHETLLNREINPRNPCRALVDTVNLLLSPGSEEINGSILTVNKGLNIFHEVDLPNFLLEAPLEKGRKVTVFPWKGKQGMIIDVKRDYYRRFIYTIEDLHTKNIGHFTRFQFEEDS